MLFGSFSNMLTFLKKSFLGSSPCDNAMAELWHEKCIASLGAQTWRFIQRIWEDCIPLPEEIRSAVLMKAGWWVEDLFAGHSEGWYELWRSQRISSSRSIYNTMDAVDGVGQFSGHSGDTAVPIDVNRVEKEKARRTRAKVTLKARTKVKVIRKVRLLERKVQTVAKAVAISSLGVRENLVCCFFHPFVWPLCFSGLSLFCFFFWPYSWWHTRCHCASHFSELVVIPLLCVLFFGVVVFWCVLFVCLPFLVCFVFDGIAHWTVYWSITSAFEAIDG